jgi:tripartite-type tricarboxylate transporter receptor subunit TctC
LNEAFKKALESDFMQDFSHRTGMTSEYLGPEDFFIFMEEEEEKYRKILTETD